MFLPRIVQTSKANALPGKLETRYKYKAFPGVIPLY